MDPVCVNQTESQTSNSYYKSYQLEGLRRTWYREHELFIPNWVEVSVHHLGFSRLQDPKICASEQYENTKTSLNSPSDTTTGPHIHSDYKIHNYLHA